MYVLVENKKIKKLPNDPPLIYHEIIASIDKHIETEPVQYHDYLKKARNILLAQKACCLAEIKLRCYAGSATLRAFFSAQPFQYYLKKDYLHWGLCLSGIIRAKTNLKFEHFLARRVQKSKLIHRNLVRACKLVYKLCLQDYPTILTSAYASFDSYNFFIIPYTVPQILKSPEKFDLNRCICALHAVSENLYYNNPKVVKVPIEKHKATDDSLERVTFQRDSFLSRFPCSKLQHINGKIDMINELSPFIIAPRSHDMPTCLPSFTTGRMLSLVKQAGGSAEELRSVAYGLFSFWQSRYWKNISGIHHYHSIMDMAANFDVPYQVFSYQNIINDLGLALDKEQQFRLAQKEKDRNYQCTLFMYVELLTSLILMPLYLLNIAVHLELDIKDALTTQLIWLLALFYKPSFDIELATLEL